MFRGLHDMFSLSQDFLPHSSLRLLTSVPHTLSFFSHNAQRFFFFKDLCWHSILQCLLSSSCPVFCYRLGVTCLLLFLLVHIATSNSMDDYYNALILAASFVLRLAYCLLSDLYVETGIMVQSWSERNTYFRHGMMSEWFRILRVK
jgi:hypothetical protein